MQFREFRVLITQLGNAAFDDDRDGEVVRILRQVADRIEAGEQHGNVRDANGARVGDYGFKIDGSMP